jgi:hypothetical protein
MIFFVIFGAYKFNVCYEPFSKIPPPPPRVAQANPIAAQKTPCLAHLHPQLRENGIIFKYILRNITYMFTNLLFFYLFLSFS